MLKTHPIYSKYPLVARDQPGSLVVHALTGQSFVCPGHPAVVATLLMLRFDDWLEASGKPPGHDFSNGLADMSIPGAGCHVRSAMNLLKLGHDGASAQEMFDYGCEVWDKGQAGGHLKNVTAGQIQAQAIKHVFVDLAQSWFKTEQEKSCASHD